MSLPQKKIVCLIVIIVVLAFCQYGCPGSPKQSSSSSDQSINKSAKSSEYYEGVYFCSGYTENGKTASYTNLTAKQKRKFPHFFIQLKSNNTAYMGSISNDGICWNKDLYEWKPTNSGINIDGDIEFDLQDDKYLVYEDSKGSTYYLKKCISGSELSVGDLSFKNITFDAPIDLVYTQDVISPKSKYYGIVNSFMEGGPTLLMTATKTDADDITELSSYYKGVEDHFVRYKEINYFVYADKKDKITDVGLVADNTWYKIKFDYSNDTAIDYSEYAETFYTTITQATDWPKAKSHIGETICVKGKVKASTYRNKSNGQPTYIDLGAAYPDDNRVTMVIWGEDRDKFTDNPESFYLGKTLLVTGKLYEYNNAVYIKVSSPKQIRCLN